MRVPPAIRDERLMTVTADQNHSFIHQRHPQMLRAWQPVRTHACRGSRRDFRQSFLRAAEALDELRCGIRSACQGGLQPMPYRRVFFHMVTRLIPRSLAAAVLLPPV